MSLSSKQGRWLRGGLTLALLLCAAAPAAAFQFTLGDVQGSLDTTVSYGLNWRVAEPDKEIIGIANGGRAYSVNGDDGNLNYKDDDYFSKVFKITSDLELKYENFGLFLRGTAFRDFVNAGGNLERTELEGDALDLVGENAELLDAFLWWDFELAGMPGTLKVGNQVLSWGESTFIQNSINTINPVDVSKLRIPGSELKEALKPVGMVSASLAANEYVSFEGFYQYDWEKTEIDPVGSYWSTSDIAGEGGDRVLLGFGQWSDLGTTWQGRVIPTPVTDSHFNMVPRGADVYADNDGQYGFAMHLMVPQANNTEFGLFYMNYHSRLPIISAKTGTRTGRNRTVTAGTAAQTFSAVLPPNPTIPQFVTAVNTAIVNGTNTGVALGLNPAVAQSVATGAVNAATAGGGTLANAYASNEYAQTAQYFLEYPEDIQLFGLSFNTQLEGSGVALQGEVSYRRDVPLQVDDLELLFAALGPINNNLAKFNQLANVNDATSHASPYEQTLDGYKRLDVTQIQVTATKAFGPMIGADQFTLVGEVGLTHVHNMPSKDKLRFESPGTYISGNQALAGAHAPTAAGKYEDSSAFADATSWGYRAVAKLDFNNAIGAVSLSPRVAWAHDVDGNSPNPGGNFLEHRKAVTVGLEANYQNAWSADLSYTDFFGAGRYNLINDRDFISFNVKYSF
ncbi:MAG: DUF1302 domain-containing protein [Desulfuromonas sp.]|nr:DUF1302 domain-containing protein [Desulfuromonas sp.]